jgi:monofunctional biosynthetic peptidoglycan transglycosylase
MATAAPTSAAARPGLLRRLWRWAWRIALGLLLFSLVWVLLYRFMPPPITFIQARDLIEGKDLQRDWVPLDAMGRHLAYAAIAAEDARFCEHNGFDMDAIEQALKANERAQKRGKTRLRGGSTISQQTAKNAFLWPQRSWVRKGLEAYFTVLMEALWPKRRILEVYLNIAEWGPGVYGAQAASQFYFDKDVDQLTRTEAARLVSILPSPLKWSPTAPSKRVNRKARNVRRAITTVRYELSGCLKG